MATTDKETAYSGSNGMNYPEMQDIRSDIDSLKHNIGELTRHIKSGGSDRARELSRELRDKASVHIDTLKSTGVSQYERLETMVKEKPGQGLAVAFCAGLFASFLLGRR